MPIEWGKVNRVLVVRLRSIGDTVLSTPSLTALRRHLPSAQIDILLEDWVAPLLEGFKDVDNVLRVGKSAVSRLRSMAAVRGGNYDVVFNLHGGTTGAFIAAVSGARYKVGFAHYRYRFLYNRVYPSGERFWDAQRIHSVEQQLALLGSAGIPVRPPPPTSLPITIEANQSISARLASARLAGKPIALMHPVAAFSTKQWAVENFARVAEHLHAHGIRTVAIASRAEKSVLDQLLAQSAVPLTIFSDLKLPEINALAVKATIFVGNDSGIAHISAAVGTPPVVIFGSSSIDNWRPWTEMPNEVVFTKFHCQPCHGYACDEFGEPKCIQQVTVESVTQAITRVLAQIEKRRADLPAVI